MTSRRKFIATSAAVAVTASILPTTGRGEPGDERETDGANGAEPMEPTRTDPMRTDPASLGARRGRDGAAELRRARSKAAAGQSIPFPEGGPEG